MTRHEEDIEKAYDSILIRARDEISETVRTLLFLSFFHVKRIMQDGSKSYVVLKEIIEI